MLENKLIDCLLIVTCYKINRNVTCQARPVPSGAEKHSSRNPTELSIGLNDFQQHPLIPPLRDISRKDPFII